MLESEAMEQQQRSLVFTAAVGLIILAIIVGSIYYLVKFLQGRVASSLKPQASVETIAQASSSPEGGNIAGAEITPGNIPQTTASEQGPLSDKKVLNAGDFQLAYPKSWGRLTCTNSQNFEFDTGNSADAKIACDFALKPVTVIIESINGCEGQTVKIGNIEVIKSKKIVDGYTAYQWCSKTTPLLNITHRVSQGGEKATSTQDYSKQIEEIISTLTFARGS